VTRRPAATELLPHLRRARDHVDRHYAEDLDLDRMAAVAGVSYVSRQLAKGSLPGLGLTVDDCRKTYEDLNAKGVTFLQEPAERPFAQA
jgi:hypothetical protein